MAAIFKNLHNVIVLSVIVQFRLQLHEMTIKSSKSKPGVEFPYGIRLFSKCGSGSISAID